LFGSGPRIITVLAASLVVWVASLATFAPAVRAFDRGTGARDRSVASARDRSTETRRGRSEVRTAEQPRGFFELAKQRLRQFKERRQHGPPMDHRVNRVILETERPGELRGNLERKGITDLKQLYAADEQLRYHSRKWREDLYLPVGVKLTVGGAKISPRSIFTRAALETGGFAVAGGFMAAAPSLFAMTTGLAAIAAPILPIIGWGLVVASGVGAAVRGWMHYRNGREALREGADQTAWERYRAMLEDQGAAGGADHGDQLANESSDDRAHDDGPADSDTDFGGADLPHTDRPHNAVPPGPMPSGQDPSQLREMMPEAPEMPDHGSHADGYDYAEAA